MLSGRAAEGRSIVGIPDAHVSRAESKLFPPCPIRREIGWSAIEMAGGEYR